MEYELSKVLSFLEQGALEDAHKILDNILKDEPDNLDAQHLKGVAFLQAHQLDEAETWLEAVHIRAPGEPLSQTHLANVRRDQGRLDEAVWLYQDVLQANSSYAPALLNLALAFERGSQKRQARLCLERYIECAPDDMNTKRYYALFLFRHYEFKTFTQYVQDHLSCEEDLELLESMAQAFEKQGKSTSAGDFAARALKLDAKSVVALKVLCALDRHAHEPQKVLERLTSVFLEDLEPFSRASLLFEKAHALKDMNRAHEALCVCREKNKCLESNLTQAQRNTRIQTLSRIARTRAMLGQEGVTKGAHYDTPHRDDEFIFLVGFPRSGTTLLESMLEAHPLLRVLEEEPLIRRVQNKIETEWSASFYGDALPFFDAHAWEVVRQTYKKELAEAFEPPLADDFCPKRVINKLPLNLVHWPFIAMLFPRARILFMKRHPYDSLLSCFFQDFSLNGAMLNFLTMERAVHFFESVMTLQREACARFPLRTHEITYEDLVTTPRGVLEGVLDFLGVAWHDDVLAFDRKAKERVIKTPSYAAVRTSLYTHARGQSRAYLSLFNGFEERLRPILDVMGYGMDFR